MTKFQKHKRLLLVVGMLAEGKTYQEIASQLGVTRQRVQQIVAPPPAVRSKVVGDGNCDRCGIYTPHGHIHHDTDHLEYLCISCHRLAHCGLLFEEVVHCSLCGKSVTLHGSKGRKRYAESRRFFCGKECQGRYAGKHYSPFGKNTLPAASIPLTRG